MKKIVLSFLALLLSSAIGSYVMAAESAECNVATLSVVHETGKAYACSSDKSHVEIVNSDVPTFRFQGACSGSALDASIANGTRAVVVPLKGIVGAANYVAVLKAGEFHATQDDNSKRLAVHASDVNTPCIEATRLDFWQWP